MDEAAISFSGAFGGSEINRPKQAAIFDCFSTRFCAGFGLAVEGLRDRGGTALLAQRNHFNLEFGGLILDLQHVANAHLASRFGADTIGHDATHLAGFRGQLARLEKARGPQPLVDASAIHGVILRSKSGDLAPIIAD